MRHSHTIKSLRDGLGQRVAIAEQNEDLLGRDAGSYQASARLSDPVGFCPVALETPNCHVSVERRRGSRIQRPESLCDSMRQQVVLDQLDASVEDQSCAAKTIL